MSSFLHRCQELELRSSCLDGKCSYPLNCLPSPKLALVSCFSWCSWAAAAASVWERPSQEPEATTSSQIALGKCLFLEASIRSLKWMTSTELKYPRLQMNRCYPSSLHLLHEELGLQRRRGGCGCEALSVSLSVTEQVCAVLLQWGSRDWAVGWCKGQWASELCVVIQRAVDMSQCLSRKERSSASMQLKMPEPGWFKCLLSPAGSPLAPHCVWFASLVCQRDVVSVCLVPSGEPGEVVQ